jgi:hypothetical protein
MNIKTRFNLWKLKKSIDPSAQFKLNLRNEINKAWNAKYGEIPWYTIAGVRPAIGFALIILLLAGSGGAYAYSNSEVTEGTILYPLKQVIETFEEATKVTPEAKAQFYLKKIERREAEREILKKKYGVTKTEKQIKHENKNGQTDEINVSSTVGSPAETEKEEIRKTEQSIEQTEQELEQSGKILEESGSQNVQLRAEIKERLNRRMENRKKQLENKIEQQKESQEDIQQEDIQAEVVQPADEENQNRLPGSID